MADLSITAANVSGTAGAWTAYAGTSGGTITAGMACYYDTATSTIKAAHCETSATTAAIKGIAMHGASATQPLQLAIAGSIDLGVTLTVGTIYVLSTAGLIAPAADLASNDYVSVIGVATVADEILLSITNSGIQVP